MENVKWNGLKGSTDDKRKQLRVILQKLGQSGMDFNFIQGGGHAGEKPLDYGLMSNISTNSLVPDWVMVEYIRIPGIEFGKHDCTWVKEKFPTNGELKDYPLSYQALKEKCNF